MPPFFIIGPPRSGTTVLRLALAAHSKIAIPHETSLLSEMVSKFQGGNELLSASEFAKRATSVKNFERVFGKGADEVEAILKNGGSSSIAAQLETVYKAYGGYECADEEVLWGDKFIGNSFIIPELANYFPGSRFIFIKRNPTDSVPSMNAKLTANYQGLNGRLYRLGTVSGASLVWSDIVEECEVELEKLGNERSISIRYEDFACDPTTILRQICDFLRLDFEEEMLSFHEDSHLNSAIPAESLSKFHENTKNPISTDYVGHGKEKLSRIQLGTINTLCGKRMQDYGYLSKCATISSVFSVLLRLRCSLEGSVFQVVIALKRWVKNF
jgi:hypothetical protein